MIDPEREKKEKKKKRRKRRKRKRICEWAERKGEFGKGVSEKIHHVCVL